MKYLIPILVVALMIQMSNVVVQASETDEVQFTQTVADNNYRHGHWCMDGRVF